MKKGNLKNITKTIVLSAVVMAGLQALAFAPTAVKEVKPKDVKSEKKQEEVRDTSPTSAVGAHSTAVETVQAISYDAKINQIIRNGMQIGGESGAAIAGLGRTAKKTNLTPIEEYSVMQANQIIGKIIEEQKAAGQEVNGDQAIELMAAQRGLDAKEVKDACGK